MPETTEPSKIVAAMALAARTRFNLIYNGSGQVHLRVVAQHQAQGLRQAGRPVDQDVLADQAVLDAHWGVEDLAVLEDDGMLDFAIADLAALIDEGERADVGVLDPSPLSDDGRPPDDALDDLGSRLDHDLPDHARVGGERPFVAG